MQRIVDRTVPTPVEVRVPQTVPVPVPVECVRYRDVPTIQEQIVEKVVTVPVPRTVPVKQVLLRSAKQSTRAPNPRQGIFPPFMICSDSSCARARGEGRHRAEALPCSEDCHP